MKSLEHLEFERDGFLVVRGMYSPQEIQELSLAIDVLASATPQVGGPMVYFEKNLQEPTQKILSRIEKFIDFDSRFSSLISGDKMTQRIKALLGEPGILFKEKINFKLPGGNGFEPHQDIQPGWDSYAPYFISVLVTVDESTLENGCLELAAGHHKRGMIGQLWQPLKGDELAGMHFVPFPMSPGDVAFFDCFVPHQSKPNHTASRRRNLYLTYNRLSDGDHRERYFSDKRKSFPPDYEREPGKEYVFRV